MDINDKLKDLDQEDLKDLNEESEELSPSVKQDDEENPAEENSDDDVEDIEVVTEDNETEDEEESVDPTYLSLSSIYATISDYGNFDIVESLTALQQYTDPSYWTAKKRALDINHKNGKQRINGSSGAMLHFDLEDGDVSEYDTMMINKIVVSMIQQYIDDHNIEKMEDLSQGEKESHINSVKVLLIIMVACNKYDYFPSLDLPKFAQKWVVDVMQSITNSQEAIFNEWIEYLGKTKNQFVADKCIEVGYEFFKNSKAIDTFGRFFSREEIGKIKKYPEVYENFLDFRDRFSKASSSITYKSLYPIFDITDDTFGKKKKIVLAEFVNKYSQVTDNPEIASDALRSIFFENSNN